MKIVFLAPFGIRPKGTLQARMLPLAVELAGQGHEPQIVAPPYTNPSDAGLVEEVQGITVRNVQLGPLGGALEAPFVAQRMLAEALRLQPDLIHLFKPKGYGGLAALALLAGQTAGLRLPSLVVDSDDREGRGGMNDLHPYSLPEKWLFAAQERWLTRWAAGVTVASRALESLAWGMGARRERTLYLPNGPVSRPCGDRMAGRQRLGIDPERPVLLLYTRFFEFSQGRLYAVLERIFTRCPQALLLVVGQGRQGEQAALEQAAIRGGYLDRLRLAGWVEPQQLPDCLAAADVALYPFDDTLVNRTKCPAKLAELAAAGLPLAAEAVGQITDYLQHGTSGLLSAPGDAPALADHAVQLLSDPERARAIGRAAAQRMDSVFAWQARATELSGLYQAIARGQGR